MISLDNGKESGCQQFHFSTTKAAVVMRRQTQFGKNAFSVCGPKILQPDSSLG